MAYWTLAVLPDSVAPGTPPPTHKSVLVIGNEKRSIRIHWGFVIQSVIHLPAIKVSDDGKRRCTKGLTGIDVHGEVLSAQKERGIISDVVRVGENAGTLVGMDVGPLLNCQASLLGDREGVVFPLRRSSVNFESDGTDEIQAGK